MKYIIYRISINENIYIGSTQNFKKRFNCHKQKYKEFCNKFKTAKLYQIIFENGGWDNIDYGIVEEFECESCIESKIREEYWRRIYNANMNTRKCFETEQEFEIRRRKSNEKYNPINNPKRDQNTVYCECGGHYKPFNKKYHLKSKMHFLFSN